MNVIDVLLSIIFLLLLMIPGFIMVKCKMLSESAEGILSKIVLYACQPALMVIAFQKVGFRTDIAINMLIVAGIAMAVHLICIGLMMLVFRNKSKDKKINSLKFASVFGNCAFMGVPFLQSVFANADQAMIGEITIYAGAVLFVFNVLTWSIGVFMMTGDKKQINLKNAVFNPTIIALVIAILLFVIVKTPLSDIFIQNSVGDKIFEGLIKSLNFFSEMITPLAMTVLGMKIANIKMGKLFADKWGYVNAFNKLIVASVITILIVAFLPVSSLVKYALFFMLSMPSATSTVLFAVNFGGDSQSSSIYVLLSTILSAISIPLMFLVMNGLFGVQI